MKKIISLLLLIVGVVNLTGCETISTNDYLEKEIGLDISTCKILELKDEHGFFGDGEYFVKASCIENSTKILDQIRDWKQLPLTKNLEVIMYGGEINGESYSHELANKVGIPKIENGYYLFIDRHSESTDIYSDEELLTRASINFTIAFYDMDTNNFYFYELDT